MMVVSSITCSSLIHLVFASFTRVFTASLGLADGMQRSTVSSFPTNSQRPSVATTTNLSVAGSKSLSVNSGSEMTPAVCATASPRDLDIAKPGTSMCPSQTLGGPSMPSSYSTAKTLPPAARMRSFSFGESGLWSCVNSSATSLPCSSFAMITRESPMFTPVILLPLMMAMESVVPLNSVSIRKLRMIWCSTLAIASADAFLTSTTQLGCEIISAASWSRKWDATPSPCSPCPSRTHRISVLVEGSSAIMRASWFFLRGL
mmetsp:Transcript_6158/g.12897  ORF Transcript_6158/g.12897 Transcript_6158/m.12897 type:complete len:260 (-) Transcript_6158:450-1229(-)